MASLVLAIFVSVPAAAQMDNKQAMMDLVIQVQQLQDEVRMLRGMLEDQTMELETWATGKETNTWISTSALPTCAVRQPVR